MCVTAGTARFPLEQECCCTVQRPCINVKDGAGAKTGSCSLIMPRCNIRKAWDGVFTLTLCYPPQGLVPPSVSSQWLTRLGIDMSAVKTSLSFIIHHCLCLIELSLIYKIGFLGWTFKKCTCSLPWFVSLLHAWVFHYSKGLKKAFPSSKSKKRKFKSYSHCNTIVNYKYYCVYLSTWICYFVQKFTNIVILNIMCMPFTVSNNVVLFVVSIYTLLYQCIFPLDE